MWEFAAGTSLQPPLDSSPEYFALSFLSARQPLRGVQPGPQTRFFWRLRVPGFRSCRSDRGRAGFKTRIFWCSRPIASVISLRHAAWAPNEVFWGGSRARAQYPCCTRNCIWKIACAYPMLFNAPWCPGSASSKIHKVRPRPRRQTLRWTAFAAHILFDAIASRPQG